MSARRTQFLDDAEAFARAASGVLAFRYFRWLTGCSEEELRQLIAKIYCDALPESSTGLESRTSSALRSLLHPLAYLATKSHAWTPEPLVESQLETLDRPYFDGWFAKVYAALKAPKRVTPRTRAGFEGFDVTERFDRSVGWATTLKLFLAPLWIPWLLSAPPPEVRPRFLRAYRKALSFFAIYDGYFQRYPCRDFVTFSDETNHPSRYLAFKRRCPGKLIVVQNGAREIHPVHAFGMVDVYLMFGEFAKKAAFDLRMRVGRVGIVGALCLAERYPVWRAFEKSGRRPDVDVMMVDQSLWPYNGIDPEAGAALLKIMDHLGGFARKRPDLRVVYQLRTYSSAAEKAAVLAEAAKRLPGVEILENSGRGESYETLCRSRLVLTFSSTLGIEGFFFGPKSALFVNYTGSPVHDFAPEPRFQLDGDGSDGAAFEKKLDELLRAPANGVPPSVREHYAYFDDQVEARIASAVAQEQKS